MKLIVYELLFLWLSLFNNKKGTRQICLKTNTQKYFFINLDKLKNKEDVFGIYLFNIKIFLQSELLLQNGVK